MAKKKTPGQVRYQRALIRRALSDLLKDAAFLNEVLTLPEVMQMYNKSRSAVLMAINTNRLIYRKSEPTPNNKGGAWLVLKASADQLWKGEK